MTPQLLGLATLLALAAGMLLGVLFIAAGVVIIRRNARRNALPGSLAAAIGLGALAAGGYGLAIMERAI